MAAVWVAPRAGGGATDVVGLVAETGRFGTLPIEVEVWTDPDPRIPGTYGKVALSPDGRRVAFVGPEGDLIVRDLVSGETHPWEFEFGIRGYTWADATHLLGRVAKGYDDEGWVWEPGTSPELVDFYTVPYGGTDLALPMQGGGPRECSWSPSLHDAQEYQQLGQGPAFEVPMLCDVLGITASEVLLGHWKSADPNDGNRTVVALDIQGAVPDCRPREPCQLSIDDPGRRRVVVTARAPEQVSFASDLIEDALDAEASAS